MTRPPERAGQKANVVIATARDLIAKLPKQKRAGRVITKDEALPVQKLDDALAAA